MSALFDFDVEAAETLAAFAAASASAAAASSFFLAAAAASFWAFVAFAALASFALAIMSFSAASAAFMAAWSLAMQAAASARHFLSGTQTFSWYGSLSAPYWTYLVTSLHTGLHCFGVQGKVKSVSVPRKFSMISRLWSGSSLVSES